MANSEQTELDLRTQTAKTLAEIAYEAITKAEETVQESSPAFVRNRHEAYGIAAEHYAKVAGGLKSVKGDMEQLLRTPADPGFPAVEAVSSLRNSSAALSTAAILMAAEMHRVLDNLYISEEKANEDTTPLDDALADFQDAEPAPAEQMEE